MNESIIFNVVVNTENRNANGIRPITSTIVIRIQGFISFSSFRKNTVKLDFLHERE